MWGSDMKSIELRNKPVNELQTELNSLLKEQFGLRMQLATQQLVKNSELKRVRRSIARVRTVLAQKVMQS